MTDDKAKALARMLLARSPPHDDQSLVGLFGRLTPTPQPSTNWLLSAALPTSPTPFGSLGGLPKNALAGLVQPPMATPKPAAPILRPEVVRKVYFSFHYTDQMRVNNVRKMWQLTPRSRTFFDRSWWESTKTESPERLKHLIRHRVRYSSAICVLTGTETWQRRWVKYEIARAVVDGRGLLTVHINSINHNQRQAPDLLGPNPLAFMGIWANEYGTHYLVERRLVQLDVPGQIEWRWVMYEDYTESLQQLPSYCTVPAGQVLPLNHFAAEYDFQTHEGRANIGIWIDAAAKLARP